MYTRDTSYNTGFWSGSWRLPRYLHMLCNVHTLAASRSKLRRCAIRYGNCMSQDRKIACCTVDSPLAVHLCWHRNLEPSVWNFAVDATRCFVSTQNRDHYHVTTRITNHRFPLPYPCNVVTQSSGHVSVPLVTIKRLCGMCINMPIVPARGGISCKESRCINNIWTLSSGLATIH